MGHLGSRGWPSGGSSMSYFPLHPPRRRRRWSVLRSSVARHVRGLRARGAWRDVPDMTDYMLRDIGLLRTDLPEVRGVLPPW